MVNRNDRLFEDPTLEDANDKPATYI